MSPFLFYLFAALTLIFGVAVVVNRNPVASALSLVVSFLGLAALFVTHPPVGQRVQRLRSLDPDWREKLRAA